MGYYRDTNDRRCFTPDDTLDTMYFAEDSLTLAQMMHRAYLHFGDGVFTNCEIRAEHIRTYCLGYDRYDPDDWTNYIVISRRK